MLDKHVVAVVFVVSRFNHLTITGCHNWRANSGNVVGAPVRFPAFLYRVETGLTEVRADVLKVDRGTQEALTHAAAFRRVVVAIFVLNSLELLALVHKLRSNNVAVTYKFTVYVTFFKYHIEGIAAANFHGKVDIPAKNTRQVHDLVVG